MSHATCTQGNWVDSRLLVIRSQIANLIPDLSFGHNLCFRYSNGSGKPILDICVSISFQWHKKLFNPLGFDPCNRFLNIQESTRTPTPKVGIPLGVWGSIPSHLLAFSGACGMTLGLLSWPATLQPLALVASLRLGLWHIMSNSSKDENQHANIHMVNDDDETNWTSKKIVDSWVGNYQLYISIIKFKLQFSMKHKIMS